MQRRTLLKTMAGGLVTVPYFSALASDDRRKSARKGNPKKLLVVFLRGGNDSLNTLAPVDPTQYNHYSNLRPNLRIPSAQLLAVPNSSFFGLHPAMSGLLPMMQAGHVSFVHCVGYPGADRSHFESQSYYETAVPGNSLLDGWINRYLAVTPGGGALIRGIGISWSIPQSVQGSIPVPVSQNFGLSEVAVDDELDSSQASAYRAKLQQLLAQTPSTGNEFVYDTGNKIFQMIAAFSNRNLDTYAPANGAVYPNTYFGNSIKHAAQMLKDTPTYLGVETCVIEQGGYDTHAGQIEPGNPVNTNDGHGYLLQELANGLAAFYRDLGPTGMSDTLVLVTSEFGRRAYENDSYGTDHGIGSLAILMNGNLSGLSYNGGAQWPGLQNNALVDGGDLNWRTDFRDIYWEILSRHMGVSNADLAQIIPSHTFSPLNFL